MKNQFDSQLRNTKLTVISPYHLGKTFSKALLRETCDSFNTSCHRRYKSNAYYIHKQLRHYRQYYGKRKIEH